MNALLEVKSIVDEANSGLLRGRTDDLAIALDARNAFNSLPWSVIIEALLARNVPGYLRNMVGSYLDGRTLTYSDAEGEKDVRLTGGIPQGSVLGPLLWNVAYDGVFGLPLPEEVHLIGFANDLLVVARRREMREVRAAAREVTETIAG